MYLDYVCIFVYLYIGMFVYWYICIFVYLYTCIFVYLYICLFVSKGSLHAGCACCKRRHRRNWLAVARFIEMISRRLVDALASQRVKTLSFLKNKPILFNQYISLLFSVLAIIGVTQWSGRAQS